MKRKKPSRKDLLASCHAVGPDDGVDPRLYFRPPPARRTDRKALQLCGAAARTLAHALAWELGDDLLSRLRVTAVVPAPDASRLLVTVTLADAVPPDEVAARLRQVTGALRAAVAAAVHRRRAPDLVFHVAPGGEGRP